MRYKTRNFNVITDLGRRLCTALLVTIGCFFVISACGSEAVLNLRTGKPEPVKLEPTLQLKKFAYKTVTIVPANKKVELKDIKLEAVLDKGVDFYATELEKVLVRYGLKVLSSDVAGLFKSGSRTPKTSDAKTLLTIGAKTKADAILLIQKIEVRGLTKYYVIQDGMVAEVEPGMVRVDDDEYYHAETEECLYPVPYYEVRIDAKAVDAATADVLWYGTGRESSIDVAPQDWVAKLEDGCELLSENYIYGDYLNNETTLETVVTTLAKRLLTPFAKDSGDGEPIVRNVKKPKVVPPPPEPEPPPPPKVKTAVVSANRATLRAEPSTRGGRKMRVPRKAKLEVLEEMGEWYKVKVQDGTVGWLHESTIIVNE